MGDTRTPCIAGVALQLDQEAESVVRGKPRSKSLLGFLKEKQDRTGEIAKDRTVWIIWWVLGYMDGTWSWVG